MTHATDLASRDAILLSLTDIIRDVLNSPTVEVTRSTTAKDVPGWDSFKMVEIVLGIEDRFAIEIDVQDVDRFQCVGDMVEAIVDKIRP